MTISLRDLQALRQASGASVTDCRRLRVDTDGDDPERRVLADDFASFMAGRVDEGELPGPAS